MSSTLQEFLANKYQPSLSQETGCDLKFLEEKCRNAEKESFPSNITGPLSLDDITGDPSLLGPSTAEVCLRTDDHTKCNFIKEGILGTRALAKRSQMLRVLLFHSLSPLPWDTFRVAVVVSHNCSSLSSFTELFPNVYWVIIETGDTQIRELPGDISGILSKRRGGYSTAKYPLDGNLAERIGKLYTALPVGVDADLFFEVGDMVSPGNITKEKIDIREEVVEKVLSIKRSRVCYSSPEFIAVPIPSEEGFFGIFGQDYYCPWSPATFTILEKAQYMSVADGVIFMQALHFNSTAKYYGIYNNNHYGAVKGMDYCGDCALEGLYWDTYNTYSKKDYGPAFLRMAETIPTKWHGESYLLNKVPVSRDVLEKKFAEIYAPQNTAKREDATGSWADMLDDDSDDDSIFASPPASPPEYFNYIPDPKRFKEDASPTTRLQYEKFLEERDIEDRKKEDKRKEDKKREGIPPPKEDGSGWVTKTKTKKKKTKKKAEETTDSRRGGWKKTDGNADSRKSGWKKTDGNAESRRGSWRRPGDNTESRRDGNGGARGNTRGRGYGGNGGNRRREEEGGNTRGRGRYGGNGGNRRREEDGGSARGRGGRGGNRGYKRRNDA